jgi:hypothetical protein
MIGVVIVISILIPNFSVLAYDQQGTAYVYRGGASKSCGVDYKDEVGVYHCMVASVDFEGLPTGIYSSNVIVTRMRTCGGDDPASFAITVTYSKYKKDLYAAYYIDKYYGGAWYSWELYESMSSESPCVSGYSTVKFTA